MYSYIYLFNLTTKLYCIETAIIKKAMFFLSEIIFIFNNLARKMCNFKIKTVARFQKQLLFVDFKSSLTLGSGGKNKFKYSYI